jgi:hypothetical protein
MRDFLANNGIPTAQSRTAVVEVFDRDSEKTKAAVTIPSYRSSMVIELTLTEARQLLSMIETHAPDGLERVRQKLIKAGAADPEPEF